MGHLWQSRYFSYSLETSHLWRAVRYVELNPVRAGVSAKAWEWPGSSARAHVKEDLQDPLLYPGWKEWMREARLGEWNYAGWRGVLDASVAEEEAALIRIATQRGQAPTSPTTELGRGPRG